ncbi:MAG: hypothetical protein F4Y49_02460 [Dehalococcoidia bacterium]|nr:hypothetical protein [Dehalococcoidia bacterium]
MTRLPGVDKERYRRSMSRLEAIFRDINETANAVSAYRCPYKNAQDRCTAKFGCRNQDRRVPYGELFICTGDDKLDYRSAWEV